MGPEIDDGREAKIVVKRLWVEIGMLKAILLKAQRGTWRDILFLREYKNYHYSKAETLLCQQRSVKSRLCFFQ